MVCVSEEKCAGCGMCVVFCPENAMKLWGYAQVDKVLCNQCLVCVELCPAEALSVENDK